MSDAELANKYQQKTDKQHILDNPDTYIGSIEEVETDMWIYDQEQKKMRLSTIKYIPALFKLFDEGIVNCRDHVIRMQQAIQNGQENAIPVSTIEIGIDDKEGVITMMNDGNGIDVAQHPEYKIWIPEMIFGTLRTSTNYDKTEKKIVGGKNGFGFKLVLIWSKWGEIETIDHVRGLKYVQRFNKNLDEICPPVITKVTKKTKPYTKISFQPDYKRFGLKSGLSADFIHLLKKRVYDICAVTHDKMKIKYNEQLIPIKNFQQYVYLYIGQEKKVYESGGERWEYAVSLSPTQEFAHVSFVNGIHTSKGGKHVEYILSQITRKVSEYIETKKKVKVTPNSIKEQLILFLRCDLENPSFDSQSKDFMNTPWNKFGSRCEVSDAFIEKVAKMGVMSAAMALTQVKTLKEIKKMDGSKTRTIHGIPKLEDANWAGTADKSSKCTIIFCEGDSAKAGILSGLSPEDRNTIGVYPMKGKILNVRGELSKKISDNKEITEIKQILGLEHRKEYKSQEDVNKYLRYGNILFMTDQDLDGHHIKALCINLFQCEWPSLLKIPGFIGYMNTPIIKAKRGTQERWFYNDVEYNMWKLLNEDAWKIKYYKGLGTSTGKEFREYFEKRKIVSFEHAGQETDNLIDMVFNKKRADDRKMWLSDYSRDVCLDTSKPVVSYDDFINKELIHFSKYDCDRSIPNLMDGLKISLRKILYSAFKKGLNSEIKVAQFTGYVSEHSGYHHGEASLNGAIVGMAQNFVGSNNINLFLPNGQFGTRVQGGKDSASERYIFTQLNKITRYIFPQQDDSILKYLEDDGFPVEPVFYSPIVPMILVNGTTGIGTGFSTDIPSYNPLQIMDYLEAKLDCKEGEYTQEWAPYYEGFQGTIEKVDSGSGNAKYLIRGKYHKVSTDTICVTELPVGFWTQNFKELLEDLIVPPEDKEKEKEKSGGKKSLPIVKEYVNNSNDISIQFTITFQKGQLDILEATKTGDINGVEKLLKLVSVCTTSNMHLFGADEKLKKYDNVVDIIDDYYTTRLAMYGVRKDKMLEILEKELLILRNKTRYIKENIDGTIDLRKKTKEEIRKLLQCKKYDLLKDDEDYKYLVKMPMDSVSEEKRTELMKEHENKETEFNTLKNTTIVELWSKELKTLREKYLEFQQDLQKERSNSKPTAPKKKVIVRKK
jgi:DNA topoisomerase-2